MKRILAPLWIAAAVVIAPDAESQEVTRVSRMDTTGIEFKALLRRIGASRGIHPRIVRITQHVEGNTYLARSGDEAYWVQLPAGESPSDGDSLDYYLEPMEGKFEYITVLGAKATVSKYRAVDLPPGDLSPDKLLPFLKKGGVIPYESGREEARCTHCKGFGYVRTTSKGSRPGLSHVDCSHCEDGTAKVPKRYVLKW